MLSFNQQTKPLIYCSQCHNSVYRTTSKLPASHPLTIKKICLYCYKHGKNMPPKARIGNCKFCMPEDVDKLNKGIWRPNVANAEYPQ